MAVTYKLAYLKKTNKKTCIIIKNIISNAREVKQLYLPCCISHLKLTLTERASHKKDTNQNFKAHKKFLFKSMISFGVGM